MKMIKQLLPLILLLSLLASCGFIEPTEATTAETTAATTAYPSVLPESFDFVAEDSDWLKLECGVSLQDYAVFDIILSSDMEGAELWAYVDNGTFIDITDRSVIGKELSVNKDELVYWDNLEENGEEWIGSEALIDLVLTKTLSDGTVCFVGFATAYVRNGAEPDYWVCGEFDYGMYVCEIVSCKELPKVDGQYQKVTREQIDRGLEILRSRAPRTRKVALSPLGEFGRIYEENYFMSRLPAIYIHLFCQLDPDMSFRVRTGDGAEELYTDYKDMKSELILSGDSRCLVQWSPRDHTLPYNTPLEREGTRHVEITMFKGEDIVGYCLVRIGVGEGMMREEVDYVASVAAYVELDTPITEAELEAVFEALKTENP